MTVGWRNFCNTASSQISKTTGATYARTAQSVKWLATGWMTRVHILRRRDFLATVSRLAEVSNSLLSIGNQGPFPWG